MDDNQYIRHTMPLIFDVPAAMAESDREQVADVLNAATGRIFDLISADERLQALLTQHGIDWGWGDASWEA
jgi:hypothetical protein